MSNAPQESLVGYYDDNPAATTPEGSSSGLRVNDVARSMRNNLEKSAREVEDALAAVSADPSTTNMLYAQEASARAKLQVEVYSNISKSISDTESAVARNLG